MSAARYDVFVTREYERQGKKETSWVRVGVAFPLKSKDGFSIQLDANPLDGKLVLFPHEDKPKGEAK